MAERYERWDPAGPIEWPCPGVSFDTPSFPYPQLRLRLEFSALTQGPDGDLVLVLDWRRVVTFSTWDEFSHPFTLRETTPDLPRLRHVDGNEYTFPLLRVLDSELVARLDPLVPVAWGGALVHLRIVSLDHTLDLVASAEPSATWSPPAGSSPVRPVPSAR